MYCVKCKSEYREGIDVCPECGCALQENIPEEESKVDLNGKSVVVYNAADDFEADIVIEKLRCEGIYACKAFKSIDSYNKLIFGKPLLGVDIIVLEAEYDEAKRIIDNDSFSEIW